MSSHYTPHFDDRPAPTARTAPDVRPASPWLWVALIATVLLAAAWWLQQRASAPLVEIESQPAATVPTTTTPTPAVRTAPATAGKRAPAATPVTRDAAPLADNVLPRYPREALRAGIEGSVVARINVDKLGNVSDVAIVKREGIRDRNLDRAVLQAVRDWRFTPAAREGRAIASVVQVPVDFRSER